MSQRSLDAALAAALAKHVQACDAAAAAADERAKRDAVALDALERRAKGERRAALIVASLQYGGPKAGASPTSPPARRAPARVACQLLGEHSPDFRWIDARLKDAMTRAASTKAGPLSLLRSTR